jgi:hypothetical protein
MPRIRSSSVHARARVVTVHDQFFLSHPERTSAEIRRDYAASRPRTRAGPTRVSPSHTRGQVISGAAWTPMWRVLVGCAGVDEFPAGRPTRPRRLRVSSARSNRARTLALLDAYEGWRRAGTVPALRIACAKGPRAYAWLERTGPRLAAHVQHVGACS